MVVSGELITVVTVIRTSLRSVTLYSIHSINLVIVWVSGMFVSFGYTVLTVITAYGALYSKENITPSRKTYVNFPKVNRPEGNSSW